MRQKLYGDDSHPGQLQRQSSPGDRGPVAGVGVSRVSFVSHMVRVRAVLCVWLHPFKWVLGQWHFGTF